MIQLRLRDEEILDAMKGEFEKEQDGWRLDVGTRLDELSSLQDEKYDNMKSHYTQKLHAAVGKIKQFCESTRQIKLLQEEMKEDMKNMGYHISTVLIFSI